MSRRKFWGWGWEGEGLTDPEVIGLGRRLQENFGIIPHGPAPAPTIQSLGLRPSRVKAPDRLTGVVSTDPWDRAEHTLGKSFHDLARGLRGEWPHPPDLVAFPRREEEIAYLLDWCAGSKVAAIPYGGGSSVAGGIEPDVPDTYAGAISIDLRHFDRVLAVDMESRAALIQAGILGPALEAALKPSGLTLRHYPQSFEMSSLGGWLATRGGGHYATLFTHIDEFVESIRMLTPAGELETRRLPGSGAGPAPDRLLLGSEGVLGVITQAWMRLQDRPRFRASAAVAFDQFENAWRAARAVAQSGLWPANCRLLDSGEALVSGAGDGRSAILILTFESGDHPLEPWLRRAVEICRGYAGRVPEDTAAEAANRIGAAGAWRDAFLRGGHVHDAMVRLGVVQETFETACTWDRFPEFHESVMSATRRAAEEVCGPAFVTCRFAYVYPDGPAPYYTVHAQGRPDRLVEQWAAIKAAASETLIRLGGTITHHHAVGRYHRRWYDQERPDLFAEALRAAKRRLDPAGILNPGALLDPEPGSITSIQTAY